jgi:hypothetical protein
METENWINEILNSSDGITKVAPNTALFSKIQMKINNQNSISKQWIWIAAASFALLLSLNVKFIFSNKSKSNNETESVISSVTNNSQLYQTDYE